MKKSVFLFSILCFFLNGNAQELHLEKCLEEVSKNYPLLKQKEIEIEINNINNDLIQQDWNPKISINGQATYQSDVTSISAPGINSPELSKDQYKAYLDVSQTIYDGGLNRIRKDIQNLNYQINTLKIEIQLRDILLQTQKYFFNALLMQENINALEISNDEINKRIKILESGVKNGSVKQSQVDILKVELIKTDQKIIELRTGKKAYLKIIALFSKLEISENEKLVKPSPYLETSENFNKRPEILSLDFQSKALDKDIEMSNSKLLPKASLFGQGGYGRPALNMLNNSFDAYYIVGARINWDINSFFNSKKEKKLTLKFKDNISIQKEVIETTLNSQLFNLNESLNKLNSLIEKDKQIIDLRAKISKVSASELDNGIITATNYLIEKNAETLAIQTLKSHEVELLSIQYEIKNLYGN
ncbi:TolC family protein [Flavobacterium sp. NRK F10]|uniref:TolC family protein n=1 Tax=Flavobacterium sp. NRK F10 TaxID=2954931 RepID=UPI00209098EA|nr:TolC family protein [Flavobacterium sp. NRK F10]MCO6175918.1 TolC family protein [Flavobacterium sp. NRK F10]